MIHHGDCLDVMAKMPAGSVNLVVTSPPYFNAEPEYATYDSYEEYLMFIGAVAKAVHRVLDDGAFFVCVTSPVLVRRTTRNHNSTRYAVPFDIHPGIVGAGFDFIDDIIWAKPDGSGAGRGRRFAADRKPLQYKSEAVTEYVIVYRRHTEKLVEHRVKRLPAETVKASRIGDYERTNIWRINPVNNKHHPAPFPPKLAADLIRLYSFVGDTVLDPFSGSGTTVREANRLGRIGVGIEIHGKYIRNAGLEDYLT